MPEPNLDLSLQYTGGIAKPTANTAGLLAIVNAAGDNLEYGRTVQSNGVLVDVLPQVKSVQTTDDTLQIVTLADTADLITLGYGESILTGRFTLIARNAAGTISAAWKRGDYKIPAAGSASKFGSDVDVDGKAVIDPIGIVAGGGSMGGFTTQGGNPVVTFKGLVGTTLNWTLAWWLEIKKWPVAV